MTPTHNPLSSYGNCIKNNINNHYMSNDFQDQYNLNTKIFSSNTSNVNQSKIINMGGGNGSIGSNCNEKNSQSNSPNFSYYNSPVRSVGFNEKY